LTGTGPLGPVPVLSRVLILLEPPIKFVEELDVIEETLPHLDIRDIRNQNPPDNVSDDILELVCDETGSIISVFLNFT
jgi:hypothetical protein